MNKIIMAGIVGSVVEENGLDKKRGSFLRLFGGGFRVFLVFFGTFLLTTPVA
jgi:hypothetical protein